MSSEPNLTKSVISTNAVVGVVIGLVVLLGTQFLQNQKASIIKEVVEQAVKPLANEVSQQRIALERLDRQFRSFSDERSHGRFGREHFNLHISELKPYIEEIRKLNPGFRDKPVHYYDQIHSQIK